MSHASNKLKWCLDKAEKELCQSNTHRGLILVPPDKIAAEKYVVKAEHNLRAALYLAKGGFSDWSTSAFFYCFYHCFLAILRKYGYESRNQECTIAVVELLKEEGKIDIDNKFIDALKIAKSEDNLVNVIKIREDFQYGVETAYKKKEEFNNLIGLCKEIIDKTREIIHK